MGREGPDVDARRAYNGRTSRQRRSLAAAADAMTGSFSAEDLEGAARATGLEVGRATVYRAVIAMQDAGFIEPVGARDGATVYARCRAEGHHHHLVCESCGSVAETACLLPEPVETAMTGGFRVTRHELTLYGRCAACADAEKER